MEQKTHTGMKSYTCKYCKKSFSNSFVCKRHERTHTGEKPYPCKYCKKSFSNSSECKRHERTHTGEKPYACKHCKRCFSQSSSCKKHEARHARVRSLKRKQHDHSFNPRRDLQEPATTLDDEKSCMLFSLSEEVKKIQAELKV